VTRDFVINGEALVKVKFGDHILELPFGESGTLHELGLAVDEVRITPTYHHRDISPDDYGGQAPAEVMTLLAEAEIRMRLVHYDVDVLDAVLAESQGLDGALFFAGRLAPAGTLLGGFSQRVAGRIASGCHFMSLNILSPQLNFPWRFPAAYLQQPPIDLPLGVRRTLVDLNWRAVPYTVPPLTVLPVVGNPIGPGEILSSGVVLWDHTLDVP